MPNEAIQISQTGQFVFVVDDANKARVRRVEVARTVGSQTVIASGLKPGEKVVIDGQLRLTDGAAVNASAKPRTEARVTSPGDESKGE